MVFVSFFLAMVCLIYGLYTLRAEKRIKVKKRLALVIGEPISFKDREEEIPFSKRLLLPAWKAWKRTFRKRMPGDKTDKIELLLLQAGNPHGMSPVEYRLLQLLLYILLPLVFIGYGMLLSLPIGGAVFLGLIGFALAGVLPKFYLRQKAKARNIKGLKELPDVLDLLTVSLEAGLGFDSALSRVVMKKPGVLSSEFQRCLEEMRLGKTRREALSGIKDRLTFDEIKVLISHILQAEKLGIGMVQVLRVQSVEVREQRKQRAEETAMKAPIKMLFPLIIFIFPSLFVVLLGPAVIQFLETFQ
ncbi:type II secretion system F family protein [Bacillaceae bacterium S4-13-58]